MIEIAVLAGGLVFTMLLGISVAPLLEQLRQRMPIPRIPGSDALQAQWLQAIAHPPESGKWVGVTERLVFFGALVGGSAEAVGIWIAFKVASKWEAWSNLGYTPDDLDDSWKAPQRLQYSAARRAWTAQSYATFVVGTALNFIFAYLGFYAAEVVKSQFVESASASCCRFHGF